MKTSYLLLFIFLLSMAACQQKSTNYIPKGLTKLSDEEMIERAKNGDMGRAEDVVVKDEKGTIIPRDSLARMTGLDEYWTVPYANADGKVVEAILRKATPEDKKLRDAINQVIKFDDKKGVLKIDIDCADKKNLLQKVYETDQAGGRQNIDQHQDEQNLTIVINLIKQCGMPTLAEVSQEQMMAIWLVIQHSDLDYMKSYLPMLEASAKKGDLDRSMIALTKDRVLMYEGKPQIYGSQVMNGKLWDLYRPEYVNKRRREVGLDPIEDYLKVFDIQFDIPQKEE